MGITCLHFILTSTCPGHAPSVVVGARRDGRIYIAPCMAGAGEVNRRVWESGGLGEAICAVGSVVQDRLVAAIVLLVPMANQALGSTCGCLPNTVE